MTSTAPGAAAGTPAGILRLGSAFCEAKAVLTAVELGVFTVLHPGPATAWQLRDRLGLQERGTRDFLDLLVAVGLLERDGPTYRNAPGADRWLVRGEPTYVGGFLERANHNLYPAWGRLAEALRTGRPQAESGFTEMIGDQGRLRRFVGMMDALTTLLGPELAQAHDWGAHGTVLDVGGARGNLLAQVVKAHPHLTGTVFDLPPMGPLFDEHMAALGLADRMAFHGGDFFADPLPPADVVVIGHVLHDWDREQRAMLLGKAYDAVRPGGAVLVYDRMLADEPDSVENLVISLDMLLTTDGGSEYPVTECRQLAEEAGFTAVTDRRLGPDDTLVVGRKA